MKPYVINIITTTLVCVSFLLVKDWVVDDLKVSSSMAFASGYFFCVCCFALGVIIKIFTED